MIVHRSHQPTRLDHFKVEERGRIVELMAIGHLIHVEVKTDWGNVLLSEIVPFKLLAELLVKIPPQPERPWNKIPEP